MPVSIAGAVKNSRRMNAYTPIVEAVVNSIDAIDYTKRKDGLITIRLYRDIKSELPMSEDETPSIASIDITDNGIGFNAANRKSFDTLYSQYKSSNGGKGYGRITFLKFFKNVKCQSLFFEDNKYFQRNFDFLINTDDELITGENVIENINSTDTKTTISLNNLLKEHKNKLNKTIDTIARKLVEKLLIYFIDEGYRCPKIVLIDESTDEEIVLNDYINKSKSIISVGTKEFTIDNEEHPLTFNVKVFKIYYSDSQSTVSLCAHNREVTQTQLHKYIPEFQGNFVDTQDTETKKNYSIKSYVLGKYLDENVTQERDAFEFPRVQDLYVKVAQEQIEKRAVDITKECFNDEITTRQQSKRKKIEEYVNKEAPWHKVLLQELNFENIPYTLTDEAIEVEFQRVKYHKEQSTKKEVKKILEDTEGFSEKLEEIVSKVTQFGVNDLSRYVASRKVVIALFEKSLQIKSADKYELEKDIHNIIFPTRKDSNDTPYDDHNLWLLDERLNFHEYLASDETIKPKGDRPDIVIFGNKIVVREGETPSNPIIIFEFKRPQRDDYTENDDPIKQICRYVEQIRGGQYKNYKGRNIQANAQTPAYGFIVCDITPKIISFCKDNSLNKNPDGEGYLGFHPGYNIYFEVISFNKMLRDATQRNKIFFKKLGIE